MEGGPDVADRRIAAFNEPGDVVDTADIPLAAALVEKRVVVVDPRGQEYTAENIGERLAMRDFTNVCASQGAGMESRVRYAVYFPSMG